MIDLSKIEKALHLDELEKIRVELLGKNGVITKEFKRMKEIPNEEKREFAKKLNETNTSLEFANIAKDVIQVIQKLK